MKLRTLETCLWFLIFFAAALVVNTALEMYVLLVRNAFSTSMTDTLSIIKGMNCVFNFLTIIFVLIGENAASNAVDQHIANEIRRDLVPRTVWDIWVGRRTFYWLTWSVIACFSFALMFLILLGTYIPAGTINVIIVILQVADVITTVLAALAATFYTYRIKKVTDPIPIREVVKKLKEERERAQASWNSTLQCIKGVELRRSFHR